MNGGLIVDKPGGLTSHDVVNRVRRLVKTKRVGHAGTLDPFATGVLVICVGRATRLNQFLVGLDKEYLANVRFGFATDTQDLTGKQISPSNSSKHLKEEEVRRAFTRFVGPQLQMPPMYSAKKVGGERLYRAARAGREVERKPVRVVVYSIEPIESAGELLHSNEDGTSDLTIRLRCSSGTYVRTLAHDLGEQLGIGAHLVGLRRTAVGPFTIDRAISLEALESKDRAVEELLIKPSELVGHLPRVMLDEEQARIAKSGRAIALMGASAEAIRLCDGDGNLIAIGEVDGARGLIKPRLVFES